MCCRDVKIWARPSSALLIHKPAGCGAAFVSLLIQTNFVKKMFFFTYSSFGEGKYDIFSSLHGTQVILITKNLCEWWWKELSFGTCMYMSYRRGKTANELLLSYLKYCTDYCTAQYYNTCQHFAPFFLEAVPLFTS